MKSKLFIITLLLVILCSITSVAATDLNSNQTIEIDSADDEMQLTETSNDVISASSTFDDLQSQINKAKEGSVITLDRNYSSSTSQIKIDKDLTIDGKGHTLDGKNSKMSIITSKNGKITLKNLIIINGEDSYTKIGGGIAIYNSAQLIIINCTFKDNKAFHYGGAIYAGSKDNDLIVINSTFTNNEGSRDGGAIYSKGTVEVQNSRFFGNDAVEGGDIYTEKPIEIMNSIFNPNGKKAGFGGSVYTKDETYIENCTFTGYNANSKGGAIYTQKNLFVTNSKFTNNTAGEGGAIYAYTARTVIDFSTFISNKATSGHGGAVYANKYTHLGNSTFIANTAENRGGAVYTDFIQFKDHVKFINNSGKGHGGAIYTCTISNHISDLYFEGNHADSDFGGALYINNKCEDVFISNSSFINNHANAGDGGAIYSDSGSTRLHIIYCNFTNNYATGGKEKRYGGAIRAKDTLYIEYCRFVGNWAANYGGAIYTNLLSHIKFSYLESNHAKEGGAVYVNNKCTITIEKSYFKSNYCNERGGAIYTDSKSTSMYIINNAFLSNNAGTEGHDVFNSGEYKSINHNWWGTNNPSFNNKLKEYHTFGSNTDHSDSNPLKMTLTGEATGYASLPVDLQVKFSDAVPSYVFDKMTVSSNKAGEFDGKLISDNQVKFSYIPEDGGAQTVSAKIDSQNMTYEIIVQKSSVYGKDLVKTYGDDKFFTAIFRYANGTFLQEGSQVTFQINGEKYEKQIIGEGQALLEEVINFLPGVYSIKSINKLTNQFFTNQLTVLPKNTTFNINDIFIMKLDDGTNKTINNKTVTFKIGDKTFISNVTDNYAIMRLNVTPGKYKMDVFSNNTVIYTINLTIANAYSQSPVPLYGSTFGTLLPIYLNETYVQINEVAYAKIAENTYRYILPTGEGLIIYNVTASNSAELTNVLRKIASTDFKADVMIINLKPGNYKITESFYKDQEWTYLIHLTHGQLYINGNGATLDDDYHHNFMTIESSAKASIENLNFNKFYRCFVNNGELYVKNAVFKENDAAKFGTKTPGSVIYNKKTATFEYCVFDNNDNSRGGGHPYHYRADLQAGVLYAEAGSMTNLIKCNFKTIYDTVHAVDGSMIVIYDNTLRDYNNLTKAINNNFEAGSCLEFRHISSLNAKKTITNSYDDFKSFLNAVNTEYYNSDASAFIVNIKNGDYTVKMKDIKRFDFRTDRFIDFFDKTDKETTFVEHKYLVDVGSRPIVINGNGAKLTLTGNSYNDDEHFAFVPKYGSLTLINMTLSGFNTALVNYGKVIVINCTFENNRVHYIKQSGEGELGGAVRNYGGFYAYNTTFKNNRATNGGAYYSTGPAAIGQFYNCTFTGNTRMTNVLWTTGDASTLYLNKFAVAKLINCNGVGKSNILCENDGVFLYRDNLNKAVLNYTVDGIAKLYRLSSIIKSNEYDIINVTFIKGEYGVFPDSEILLKPDYVELILNGNGAKIFVSNQKDNDDTQLLVSTKRSSTFINNLAIQGFNIAIENNGGLTIFGSSFNANKADYTHKKDYGGAIVNTGSLTIYNSSFTNGYAKYAGAIYNNKGTLVVYITNFTNNKGYSSNSLVDIYNNEASAQIITTGAYPKVVDHFPMAAWKQELIETAILAGTTIITAGVSWGITAAGVACAHAINMLVGTTVGAIGGLINGFVYSVDHQDYSTFTKRLMDGINDGISAVGIGEKLSTLFGDGFIPFEDMTLHRLTKTAATVLIDNFIARNFKLIEQWVISPTNHKMDNRVWHSHIKFIA